MLRRIIVFAFCVALGLGAFAQDVETILHNGNVVTVDSLKPTARANAVADGKILAVGNNREILALKTANTKIIDLKNKTVVPGFIESHAHLAGIGQMLTQLDLTRADSWEEIVQLVATAAKKAKPGDWIIGRGWHQSLWKK